jgi:hypothetical protein
MKKGGTGGLFCDLLRCFDNRSRSDARVADEFVRLAAVRDRANPKLMQLDAFRPNRAEHRITESTVCIMIFDGEEPPLRGPGTVQQRHAVDGDDTIEIHDPHGDAGSAGRGAAYLSGPIGPVAKELALAEIT